MSFSGSYRRMSCFKSDLNERHLFLLFSCETNESLHQITDFKTKILESYKTKKKVYLNAKHFFEIYKKHYRVTIPYLN